ncbi:hypothetical protein K461DRAFT_279343 [Myriangium duriaei CBS 260.36]|uniref:Zn(2)-C6 fungal-type domain-containing protein n=1 Tax=Myriangium duriaei CBS 260.36 TaxID=1168546 RepID=A0A9P4MG67_9PEZI|nr:hypothetical protein K461DRAFT_279343 [Myriangium duriaei CBS 260.36]
MPDSRPAFNFNSAEPLPSLNSADTSVTGTPSTHRAALSGLNDDGGVSRKSSTPPPHPTSHPAAPVVDSQGRILNPRSCVTCRRRKVKCDKLHPCSNCARAHIECIFPNPGRAPRKPRKHVESRDSELLARLRRLEGVVKTLGVEVPAGDAGNDKHHATRPSIESPSATSPSNEHPHHAAPRKSLDHSTPSSTNSFDGAGHHHANGGLENRFGRLVVSEGRSRYVNTSFWASLSNEVEDLKGILGDDSEEEDEGSPGVSHGHTPSHHQGWMFKFSSHNVDMLTLHPIPTQIPVYWSIFKDRVDPLVKVLHLPSITPTILASSSHLGNLSRGFEALLFAIYYGATTSLSPKECLSMLGEERGTLLHRYRFGVEQALARAGFLTAEEMVIIQAFVLFLMCLRRNSSARVIWTLTGLLVRMSQTMGIHRDGTHFGLDPFEIEMRRRLWWQICLLDSRASEDHGCDPTIVEQSFDTKMPMNVNDTDIGPGMPEFPKEHVGCTDMSFCLIRFEVANTFRRLNYVPPGPKFCGGPDDFSPISLQQKEQWIQEMHDTLEEKYLKHCDMTIPLYWVTATVSRLIMSKMWLMVYHPLQRNDVHNSLSDEIRDKLFITSLENIEYGILLQTETRTMQWGWLFRTYMQWHALALLLTELCKRTRGPLVDRAWIAVDQVHDILRELNSTGGAIFLWKPIDRLLAKAKAARQKALNEDAAGREMKQEQMSDQYLPPGSVAHILQESRQDSRSSATSPGTPEFAHSVGPPSFGSLINDSVKLLSSSSRSLSLSSKSPTLATQGQNNGQLNNGQPNNNQQSNAQQPNGIGARTESPTSYLDAKDTSTATNVGPQGFGNVGMPDWSNSMAAGGTMDSTMSFGADNPNNFTMSHILAANNNNNNVMNNNNMAQLEDMSMTFDANGDLDWANWDNMVRQFGMDIDQTPGDAVASQPVPWNVPGWNGVGNPAGAMQSDWF